MIAESLLQILAGMALLFLAQARIQRALEDLVLERFTSKVIRTLGNSGALWLIGTLASFLLQTSRVPLRVASQLVERRMLSIEQGFIVLLGVSLGASFKTWFFAAHLQIQVALAFLFSGLIFSLFRKTRLGLLGIPFIAVGCFWASLELIWQGMEPFVLTLSSQSILAWLHQTNWMTHMSLMLVGVLLVVFLRTSTLSLFMVIEFASLGGLSLETGAAMILGLNLGMALAGFENKSKKASVQQLHWSAIFNRCFFWLLFVILMPNFLQAVVALMPESWHLSLPFQLALFHILFNLVLALGGFLVMGLSSRFASWIAPGESNYPAVLLSFRVRRMLHRSPSYALKEAENQLQIVLEHTKQLSDHDSRLLLENKLQLNEDDTEHYLFDSIQHSVYDLLLPLYEQENEALRNQIQSYLRVLDHCVQLHQHAIQFNQLLKTGLGLDHFRLSPTLKPALEQYQNEFNELWLSVLLKRNYYRGVEALESSLEKLEELYYEQESKAEQHAEELIWAYRVLAFMRQQSVLLYQVYQARQVA